MYKKLKLFLNATPGQQNTNFNKSTKEAESQSPYNILEVSDHASQEEIHRAYKQKIAEYHPDKVNHLGKEIQNLAQQKTQLINWAYNQLKK